MASQEHNFEQPPVYREIPSRGNGMSNFLSGVAVLLSTLALVVSGFTAYQVFTLQQTLNVAFNQRNAGVNQTYPNSVSDPRSSSNSTPVNPSSTTDSALPLATTPTSTSSAGVQPGQFVQPAFGNSAQVELLAVKRIKDPQTGRKDIVNVQFRLRRLTEQFPGGSSLYAGSTTARNPDTSETYQPADAINHATNTVLLANVRVGASVDGYVWMRIPEGVNTVDLLFENTQAFKNVPISS